MNLLSNMRVKLGSLVVTFSKTLDYVDKTLSNHHLRVAVIADDIAQACGLSSKIRKEIFMAAALHDLGVFSLQEKKKIAEYDLINPFVHTEKGYLLIKDFEILRDIAPIVRHHHVRWDDGKGRYSDDDEEIHPGAHIIHIADRIEILLNKTAEVLKQKDPIIKAIRSRSNRLFNPQLVEAFGELSQKECFWFDTSYLELDELLLNRDLLPERELDIEDLEEVARLFSHIIDFRSSFTSVHSAGVSAVASALAKLAGFSTLECRLMAIAGHLHDIGKLAVPVEILQKPSKLDDEQMNIMKSHIYYSYRILDSVKGLETINMWASFHHERMDGNGYPFHLNGSSLPMGSRIMAVADVLTAISEDRPYRKGMDVDTALPLLASLGSKNTLDKEIVKLAAANFNYLNKYRQEVQMRVKEEYDKLKVGDCMALQGA
ncbi:MAG: HD domain-containing protein [Candidatus Magnetominusculus sp. LBB02]|nr:HD domain-containing protein [Candidatus Magnetominusculus sp. LBB02]